MEFRCGQRLIFNSFHPSILITFTCFTYEKRVEKFERGAHSTERCWRYNNDKLR